MVNTRYRDAFGNTERLDLAGNHFINGKCANPKSWVDCPIGGTFDSEGLVEAPLEEDLQVTGHVTEFSYYDHDAKETVFVVAP